MKLWRKFSILPIFLFKKFNANQSMSKQDIYDLCTSLGFLGIFGRTWRSPVLCEFSLTPFQQYFRQITTVSNLIHAVLQVLLSPSYSTLLVESIACRNFSGDKLSRNPDVILGFAGIKFRERGKFWWNILILMQFLVISHAIFREHLWKYEVAGINFRAWTKNSQNRKTFYLRYFLPWSSCWMLFLLLLLIMCLCVNCVNFNSISWLKFFESWSFTRSWKSHPWNFLFCLFEVLSCYLEKDASWWIY